MSREPYSGAERKLLLAFDVGLTHSGISYCILEPGEVPEIQGVHKFPGQEMAGGNAKIPSVMYYSKDGRVRAAGAEAERDGMDIVAGERDWVKTEWFKLHLRPRAMHFIPGNAGIPPLPLGKTVVGVLSDFLEYLNDCARHYIQQVHPGVGTSIWSGTEIHYILPHPNGWEGSQKALMKQAAEKAGLITPNGRNQLTFIAEGEACLHRAISGKGFMSKSIRNGDGINIVDAGRGTLDISAYAYKPHSKNFEEIAESQCHFKGSIFVTEAAAEYLKKLLKGSKFVKDIPTMKQYFDKTTKCSFSDPDDPHFIKFGSVDDRDTRLKITRGNLRLDGKVIASFFEPSIKCMIDGVLSQRQIAHKKISTVFLIGGFAASDYVFRRVKEDLKHHGLQVFRPDTQINKVVADGAISKILACPSDCPLEQVVGGSKPRDLEVFGKNAKNESVLIPNVFKPPTSAPTPTTVVITSQSTPAAGTSTNTTVATPPSPPQASQGLPLVTPSSRFDKLTGDNYLEWKVYMTASLISKGLLGVVDGSEGHPGGVEETKKVKKFQNKKARARAELILHVSPSQLIHCTHDDPAVVWNTLATAHAAHTRVTINTLRRKLHKVRLEHDETMSAFIKRVRHMAFLVKAAGGDIDDDNVTLFITAGLPSSYDSCIAVIDALPDSEYNVDVISAHLIREYQQHSNPRT